MTPTLIIQGAIQILGLAGAITLAALGKITGTDALAVVTLVMGAGAGITGAHVGAAASTPGGAVLSATVPAGGRQQA